MKENSQMPTTDTLFEQDDADVSMKVIIFSCTLKRQIFRRTNDKCF